MYVMAIGSIDSSYIPHELKQRYEKLNKELKRKRLSKTESIDDLDKILMSSLKKLSPKKISTNETLNKLYSKPLSERI